LTIWDEGHQIWLCVYKNFTKIESQSAKEQMPLRKITNGNGHTWGIWKVEEDEKFFFQELNGVGDIPAALTNSKKRIEWLAGRVLVKELMEQSGLTFKGIVKNDFGKPFPVESSYQLSLSHSYPYVAAYLHERESIGIDLEQPKEKLFRIAPRILDDEELMTAGDDLNKHCVIWCAKEVLVKVHGKKDLIFAANLKIDSFSMNSSGILTGRIIVNSHHTIVPLYYELESDFIIVLNKPD
jgi:phosphopantetheinyl transferase